MRRPNVYEDDESRAAVTVALLLSGLAGALSSALVIWALWL